MECTQYLEQQALASFEFEDLKGLILSEVTHIGDALIFTCIDGNRFRMNHIQDCCEDVCLEDVCGDIEDLLNSPILLAEETSRAGFGGQGSETWTFYHISTKKGGVAIRWYGTSNGYYSEGVGFNWIRPNV